MRISASWKIRISDEIEIEKKACAWGRLWYNAIMRHFSGKRWLCGGRSIVFDRPWVMGIVNVTPDSFYSGSRTPGVAEAVARGEALWRAGAACLDVGGESTRPGAEAVSVADEIARVVPVLKGLRAACPGVLLSVDTRHTAVARAAIAAGAEVVNDVAGCAPDVGMRELVAETGVGYVLMHARGTPQTMDRLVEYREVVGDVERELMGAVAGLMAAGVREGQLMLDPGLGFAKRHADSLRLLGATAHFAGLRYPYLVAASRKRFLGEVTGRSQAEERGAASVGAALWAIAQGADMVRVHDVAETVDALRVFVAAGEVADV